MRERGITLIELLISLSIVGIVLGMAVPAFLSYLSDAKIRAVAESITAGLNRARTEAIMRNTPVQFVPTGTSWQVVLPGNPAQILATNEGASFGASLVTAPSAANITFTGMGRTLGAALFTLAISNPTVGACAGAGGNVRCLQVQVTTTGSVKMCDPAVAATDPRAC